MGSNLEHLIGAHVTDVLSNAPMPKRHQPGPTYEEFVKRIGENIRAARNTRGISTEQLATKSGLVASTVAHLETGVVKAPVLQTLLKIANALDAPPALLFDMGGERRYTDEVRQVIASLQHIIDRESKE